MNKLHFENANPFTEFQDITLLWTTADSKNVFGLEYATTPYSFSCTDAVE